MSKHIKKNKKHKKSAIKERKRNEKQARLDNELKIEKKSENEGRWRKNIH